jgi:hypothetical protein
MSDVVFTNIGEVLKKQQREGEEEPKNKNHIKLSRDVILPETKYTNKNGKVVTLPEVRLPKGSYIQLLDPNRGSVTKPDFVKFDLVHIYDKK